MVITPISTALNARVRVPGSKSLTNRALLVAALSNGTTKLDNALFSHDTLYFAGALRTLGFEVDLDPGLSSMRVKGLGGRIPARKADLFIGNAGTAARFLTAFLTLGEGIFSLDGSRRMRERPMNDLIEALNGFGARVNPLRAHGRLPVEIEASGLPGGRTSITGNLSSQFLSALLMVAPNARSTVEIVVTTGLNSKPYVDLTLAVMSDFGVDIEREGYSRFKIHPAAYRPVPQYTIEPDASAAAYFFAAPAICGGTVLVENLDRHSMQGDVAFVDVLAQMGCVVEETVRGLQVTGNHELRGIDVDMRDIPDTAQTLAVVAPFANSPTRIRGIASAREKETDRIAATCLELTRLGVRVDEHEDGMTVHPCKQFHPATVRTYNDHRMAMAFSLIGFRTPDVNIENPGCVGKTFPGFFETLESLR